MTKTPTPCSRCKWSHGIDAKHFKYYCIPPDGSRSFVVNANHTCEKGEPKK